MPPARMSASVSDFGPATRFAVSHRMGVTRAATRRPVTKGSGLTSRLMELSVAVVDGQNWPSCRGTRIVDVFGDALVTEAMSNPDSEGVAVLKKLCAAALPETVGVVDKRTVQVPSAAPAAELVVFVTLDGAGIEHDTGTAPPISARRRL